MRAVKLRPWIRRLKRWRAERWLAVASIVIAAGSMVVAIFSVGLSAYSAYLMRQQARLSVQPKFTISFMFNDMGAGWIGENDGLGPARLRGFRVLIDGVEQTPPVEFAKMIVDGLHLTPAKQTYLFLNPSAGGMILPGRPIKYFWGPPAESETLKSDYRKVEIDFCYCSIYDECWTGTAGEEPSVRDDACSLFSSEPISFWWKG